MVLVYREEFKNLFIYFFILGGNFMKKIIAVLLSLVILLCVVITANAVNYGRNAETVQPTTSATENPEPDRN